MQWEENIVAPMKSYFYKRYQYDMYIQRKKNELESLFEELNFYHPTIKLTIEKNPTKFLDTEITRCGCVIETNVYSKFKKLLEHWSSNISAKYKCNAMTSKLYRANKIATAFNCGIKRISRNF